MNYKNLLLSLLCFFSLTILSAQKESSATPDFSDVPVLSPEKSAYYIENKTRLTIKSNVYDAKVFINGHYQGETTLILNNLSEGHYHLKVEKHGYETEHFTINLRRGHEYTYYVELKKLTGFVSVITEPENAQIYVDGSAVSQFHGSLKLPEGAHTIQVKKFGFNPESKTIYVLRHSHQELNFVLSEAEFSVNGFRADKKSFNPELAGPAGSIIFTFRVTKNGTADIDIYNSQNERVDTIHKSNFTTWNQTVFWSPSDKSEEALPDGKYYAVLTAGDFKFKTSFQLDRTIIIPVCMITPYGTGIGCVPQACIYPETTASIQISSSLCFKNPSMHFYGFMMDSAFSYTPLNFLELTAGIGFMAQKREEPSYAYGGVKFSFDEPVESGKLNWAILFNAGGFTENTELDRMLGTGISSGIAVGFNNKYNSFNLSGMFVFDALDSKDTLPYYLKFGGSAQIKSNIMSFTPYISYNNYFNDYSVQAGLNLTLQPGNSIFYINLEGSAVYQNSITYPKFSTGLSLVL